MVLMSSLRPNESAQFYRASQSYYRCDDARGEKIGVRSSQSQTGKTLQLTSSPVVEVTRSVQSQRGPGQPRIVPVRHPLNRACRVDSVFVLDKFYRTANDVNKFVRHAVNIGNPSACQPVRVHYKMQRQ